MRQSYANNWDNVRVLFQKTIEGKDTTLDTLGVSADNICKYNQNFQYVMGIIRDECVMVE